MIEVFMVLSHVQVCYSFEDYYYFYLLLTFMRFMPLLMHNLETICCIFNFTVHYEGVIPRFLRMLSGVFFYRDSEVGRLEALLFLMFNLCSC